MLLRCSVCECGRPLTLCALTTLASAIRRSFTTLYQMHKVAYLDTAERLAVDSQLVCSCLDRLRIEAPAGYNGRI